MKFDWLNLTRENLHEGAYPYLQSFSSVLVTIAARRRKRGKLPPFAKTATSEGPRKASCARIPGADTPR